MQSNIETVLQNLEFLHSSNLNNTHFLNPIAKPSRVHPSTLNDDLKL